MEFGQVKEEELAQIDFRLPDDHPENARVLKGKRVAKPEVYVGCAKWGRKEWVGTLYPKGTKEKDFLVEYGKHFNSIELNSLFYQLQPEPVIEKWRDSVPAGFKFCPKFTSSITHIRRLKNVGADLERFLHVINSFGDKLGPLFLMPHPGMAPKTIEQIADFIKQVPPDYKLFVELRHPDWYLPPNNHEMESLLAELKAGYVITDTAGRRDMLHMRHTIPQAFVRFVGNSLHPTDYTRIDEWVLRIRQWLDQGLEKLYFFMHMHDEAYSPQLISYLIKKLNAECGLDLQEPKVADTNADAQKSMPLT